MVDLLMASYNGGKFMREQFESLQKQSFEDWRVIIHDDGSSDDTVDIIKDVVRGDSRFVLMDDGKRIGSSGGNFLHCLQYSDAPFIMFCDQDDIWLPHKIETHLRLISQRDQSVPQVVYSQSSVWNSQSGISGNTTHFFAERIQSVLFQNGGVQGCAAMFNDKAREIMKKWSGPLSMHDHLLQLVCASMGEISHTDESLMLYRRHESAVTGATKTKIFSLETLNSKYPVIDRKHYETVKHFVEIYKEALSEETKHYIDEYLKMPDLSWFSRIKTVIRDGFMLYDSTPLLLIKMLFRQYIA